MFLVGSAGVKHQKDTEKADSVVGAGASRSLLDLCSRAAEQQLVTQCSEQAASLHTHTPNIMKHYHSCCNEFSLNTKEDCTTSVRSRVSSEATISNCFSKTYWMLLTSAVTEENWKPIRFRGAVWNHSFRAHSTIDRCSDWLIQMRLLQGDTDAIHLGRLTKTPHSTKLIYHSHVAINDTWIACFSSSKPL